MMQDKNGKEIVVGARVHITGGIMLDEKNREVDRDIVAVVERLTDRAVVCQRFGGRTIPTFFPSNCEVIG